MGNRDFWVFWELLDMILLPQGSNVAAITLSVSWPTLGETLPSVAFSRGVPVPVMYWSF